jgi:hypothetical protein
MHVGLWVTVLEFEVWCTIVNAYFIFSLGCMYVPGYLMYMYVLRVGILILGIWIVESIGWFFSFWLGWFVSVFGEI